ncbi:MAG: ABC transporter ATP-binding protein [Ferruginibacter sp.]
MKYSSFQLIKRIFRNARQFWPRLLVLFLLSLLATPIALLKPYALKLMIDSGFGSKPVPDFIRVFFPDSFDFTFSAIILIAAALVIIIALIENLYGFVSWLMETFVGEKMVLYFRAMLFDHIQRLSLAYHDRKGSADSLYRIQWDTMCIRSLLVEQLSPLLSSFITLLSMIVVMFMINPGFAIISLCIIPPLFVLTRLSATRLRKDWYKVKEAESAAMTVLHEVLNSLRVVKSFGREESEGERFFKSSDHAVKGQIKMARIGAFFSFLIGMLIAAGTALFFYIGALHVQSGKMTLGELTLVLAYLAMVFGPLQSISKNLNEVQSSLVSIDRVFAVLDEEKEVEEHPQAERLPPVKGHFEFKNVGFSYQQDKPTLQDISFMIQAGDRVGIMGTTGAGKSTLISLLNRFYDPSAGMISIDGVDIKNYKLADYRDQFSIVLQEPVLFSTSIGENISYGRPGATDKEIIEAAKAANAHDFIMKTANGYDTPVGERGMQLSGGERQRISLARAFIKNAPVLILDEPTGSLDIKTEAQIMEAMERLMKGRTTFMITHRLDTLEACNIILHLEQGRLMEIVRDHDADFLKEKKITLLKGT